MTQVQQCPICEGNILSPFLNCKDYTVSHETFTIQECSHCKFLLTSPVPGPSELPEYYKSDTYISHSPKATTWIDRIYLTARGFTLKWKLQLIQNYLTHSDSNNLLDYGCGTGEFLKSCKSAGFQVQGIEPSEKGRNQSMLATSQSIYGTISELPADNFQVITLWHVLEHITDLNQTLSQLNKKLTHTGTIFIAVPNHNSWDATHYQNHWGAYDVPRHLWHFSQADMQSLLAKHSLKIIDKIPMKLDAFYVSLLSEKYRNNGKLNFSGLFSAFYNGIKSNLLARKNLEYSSLIYVVRK